MGWAKDQLIELEQFLSDEASFDEAASRLRMSTLCRAMVRPLCCPLHARIVELSHFMLESNVEFGRV